MRERAAGKGPNFLSRRLSGLSSLRMSITMGEAFEHALTFSLVDRLPSKHELIVECLPWERNPSELN
jgi:hypothetical protein